MASASCLSPGAQAPPSPAPQDAGARRFGLAVVGVYTALGFALSGWFPFYAFPMFSEASTHRSRIVAVTDGGRSYTLDAFDRWHCEDAPTLRQTAATCPGDRVMPAELEPWQGLLVNGHAPALDHVLARHSAPPLDTHVWLTQQVYRATGDDGSLELVECPIAACTVAAAR